MRTHFHAWNSDWDSSKVDYCPFNSTPSHAKQMDLFSIRRNKIIGEKREIFCGLLLGAKCLYSEYTSEYRPKRILNLNLFVKFYFRTKFSLAIETTWKLTTIFRKRMPFALVNELTAIVGWDSGSETIGIEAQFYSTVKIRKLL